MGVRVRETFDQDLVDVHIKINRQEWETFQRYFSTLGASKAIRFLIHRQIEHIQRKVEEASSHEQFAPAGSPTPLDE